MTDRGELKEIGYGWLDGPIFNAAGRFEDIERTREVERIREEVRNREPSPFFFSRTPGPSSVPIFFPYYS